MLSTPIIAGDAPRDLRIMILMLPILVGAILLILYFFNRKTIFKIDYAGGSIGFDTRWIGPDEATNFQKNLRIYKDLANSSTVVTASSNVQINNGGGVSAADELVRYNELLKQGVITQEDYDSKKRQLLGLQ